MDPVPNTNTVKLNVTCQTRDDSEWINVALPGTLWRVLAPVGSIQEFWSVRELQLLRGTDCNVSSAGNQAHRPNWYPASGKVKPISSEANIDGHMNGSPYFAFDGYVSEQLTLHNDVANPRIFSWRAQNNGQAGWLGLDLRPLGLGALDVRCIALVQDDDLRYAASKLSLQRWNGGSWDVTLEVENAWAGSWIRRPADSGSQWRLVHTEKLQAPWTVQELDMYSDAGCHSKITEGVPIASNAEISDSAGQAWPLRNAFDNLTSTSWKPKCAEITGCVANESWIGLDFGIWKQYGWGQVQVRCVRLLQEAFVGAGARSDLDAALPGASRTYPHDVQVQFVSAGDRWSSAFRLTELWPGKWNARPSAVGTLWRVRATVSTKESWQVNDVEFFTDGLCSANNQVGVAGSQHSSSFWATGSPISSGESLFPSAPAALAFDGNLNTSWVAPCSPCVASEAWIGLDFGADQVPFLKDGAEFGVRCIRLHQASSTNAGDLAKTADSAVLEGWNWL
jgi:hypothetical protein